MWVWPQVPVRGPSAIRPRTPPPRQPEPPPPGASQKEPRGWEEEGGGGWGGKGCGLREGRLQSCNGGGWRGPSKRQLRPDPHLMPDIAQSEIAATNFYDRARFWAKNWAKNWAKFWTKFSGHFRASCAVQNDPQKLLPKFLPVYHSMSCHGSCG